MSLLLQCWPGLVDAVVTRASEFHQTLCGFGVLIGQRRAVGSPGI